MAEREDALLRPTAVAIVRSKDGVGFHLGLACASSDGAEQFTLMPDRFEHRTAAVEAARDRYPGIPLKGD